LRELCREVKTGKITGISPLNFLLYTILSGNEILAATISPQGGSKDRKNNEQVEECSLNQVSRVSLIYSRPLVGRVREGEQDQILTKLNGIRKLRVGARRKQG